MAYSFRLRCVLPSAGYVPFEERTRRLSDADGSVQFSSGDRETNLEDADRIVVKGHGYTTEEDARTAGERWRHRLEQAFAATRIPADFGDRSASGTFTLAGLQILAQGRRILNDVHGLMTFRSEPEPDGFTGTSVRAQVSPSPEAVARAGDCVCEGYVVGEAQPDVRPLQQIALC